MSCVDDLAANKTDAEFLASGERRSRSFGEWTVGRNARRRFLKEVTFQSDPKGVQELVARRSEGRVRERPLV